MVDLSLSSSVLDVVEVKIQVKATVVDLAVNAFFEGLLTEAAGRLLDRPSMEAV